MQNEISDQRPVRVADLYCGEGAATKAAISAGMEVVYAYEPVGYARDRYITNTGLPVDGALGPMTMLEAPEFDVLMVNVHAAACLSEPVLAQALRLLGERQPGAVVFEGPTPRTSGDSMVLGDICRSLEDLGYHVCWRQKLGDDFTDLARTWRTVIIGTRQKVVFVWPDEVGSENGARRFYVETRRGRIPGQPSPLLSAVMGAVDVALHGPVMVEVWVPPEIQNEAEDTGR